MENVNMSYFTVVMKCRRMPKDVNFLQASILVEIEEAIHSIKKNVKKKYGIDIFDYEVFQSMIVLHCCRPKKSLLEIKAKFFVGISRYLLKTYPEIFRQFKDAGTNLFTYEVQEKEEEKTQSAFQDDDFVNFNAIRELIVDMTLRGATFDELQDVIEFSKILIDCQKAWEHFGIKELSNKYSRHEHTE